jgi:hypothetical protein
MPRTAAGSSRSAKDEHIKQFPKEAFDDLKLEKQIACYLFWLFTYTNGAQGWNPHDRPGSVRKWRTSKYISTHIKEGSWPAIGKVSGCFLF